MILLGKRLDPMRAWTMATIFMALMEADWLGVDATRPD